MPPNGMIIPPTAQGVIGGQVTYLSSVEPELSFGLGTAEEAMVTVVFPGGERRDYMDVKSRTVLTAERP